MTNPTTTTTDPLAAALRVKELAAKASEGWAAWWRDATGSNDWAGKAMVAGLPFTAVDRMPAFHRDDAIYIAETRTLAPVLADAVLAHERTTREQADLNLALAAENERLNAQLDADISVGVRQCELLREARAEIGRMKDGRDKLQAFKTWVHDFLDAKGIPHHPPGTHGAAGCRIGDRMDYVFAEMGRLRAALERIQRASICAGTDDPEAIEGIALAAVPPPGADTDSPANSGE